MPNINAAVGLAQLEQLPAFLNAKRRLADTYKYFFGIPDEEFFHANPGNNQFYSLVFVPEPVNTIANFWLNCIILPNKDQRDEFLKYTNENGVMTKPAWQPLNFYMN